MKNKIIEILIIVVVGIAVVLTIIFGLNGAVTEWIIIGGLALLAIILGVVDIIIRKTKKKD